MNSNRSTRVLVTNEVCFPSLNKLSKQGSQTALFPTLEISVPKENVKTHVLQQVRVSTSQKSSNHPTEKITLTPLLQKNYANHGDKVQTLKTPPFGTSEKEQIPEESGMVKQETVPYVFSYGIPHLHILSVTYYLFTNRNKRFFLYSTYKLLNGTG